MTPRLPSYLRATSFRLTTLAAALFAAFAVMLLAYIYGATAAALSRQSDRAVSAEIEELSRLYSASGLSALNRAVIQRSLSSSEFLYLLVYETGRRVSGNLDTLPDGLGRDGDVARFEYQRPNDRGDIELRRARGRAAALPGGYRLLVGVDVDEDARIIDRIARESWTALGFVLAVALLLGAFLSQRFVRRVDGINAVARDVRAGDLHARAPRTNSGDELDTLSENFNAMLDRIERLMASMRHAGDSIAHDLRSPLTRLRNRLESAMRDVGDSPAGDALEAALSDADELLATFNAILRIARLEAGERRGAFETLALSDLITDLAELYEPVGEEKSIEFTSEIEPDVSMRGDKALIGQATSNLLDNAMKYTPAGGAVALRMRTRSTGEFEISVTDTGPGIPAPERERVKQRFVRLDESRSHAGSGLGLTLVQAVAEAHNGRFELADGPGAVDGDGVGLFASLVFPAELDA